MKLMIISKDIQKENRTKISIKKRKFRISLFNAKIFRLKLLFFLKRPEIGNFTICDPVADPKKYDPVT